MRAEKIAELYRQNRRILLWHASRLLGGDRFLAEDVLHNAMVYCMCCKREPNKALMLGSVRFHAQMMFKHRSKVHSLTMPADAKRCERLTSTFPVQVFGVNLAGAYREVA